MNSFSDVIMNLILFLLIMILIIVNSKGIVSLEDKVGKLESYHSNICSECGQVLHN